MRIIAKLDVKPPNVIKPVHFEGLRKLGKPAILAQQYYLQGADEIAYIDIVSSLYQRSLIVDSIEETANSIFIPFMVGGAVRNINDFSNLFHHGADKVSVNTHVVQKDSKLIDEAAKIFGSQAVVVNIEAKKSKREWCCYTDCGRIPSDKNVVEWAYEAQERGAGEILLQSVDADGRQKGFDKDLIEKVISKVKIPVIAASGAGSLEDIVNLAVEVRPSAVAVSSVLHYEKLTIMEIKEALKSKGVEVSL